MADGSLRLAGWIPKLARAAYVGLAVGLVSCARSRSQEVEEARAKIRSWDATLRLIDTAAAVGAVPEHFADEARQAVAQGRAEARAKLDQVRGP